VAKGLNMQKRGLRPADATDWRQASAIRRANKQLKLLQKKIKNGTATATEQRQYREWQRRMERITRNG
jgi:hypothetical protein